MVIHQQQCCREVMGQTAVRAGKALPVHCHEGAIFKQTSNATHFLTSYGLCTAWISKFGAYFRVNVNRSEQTQIIRFWLWESKRKLKKFDFFCLFCNFELKTYAFLYILSNNIALFYPQSLIKSSLINLINSRHWTMELR